MSVWQLSFDAVM